MSKKKTVVYWLGLILLCASLVALFNLYWILAFTRSMRDVFLLPMIPVTISAKVFIIVGIYMMREGVE